MSQKGDFDYVRWIQKSFSLVPEWVVEPEIQAIRKTIENLKSSSQDVKVTFLAQGALNKLYSIEVGFERFVLKVSLPVDPWFKTSSEVATIAWVQQNTNLPVPTVLDYRENRDNIIGFEWILMSKISGITLSKAWRTIQFSAKEQLVRQLATYSSSLFYHQLCGIGNIYPNAQSNAAEKDSWLSEVKRIVSMHFFWGDRILQNVPRGPFRSSKDWILARLAFNENDCRTKIANLDGKSSLDSDDEDDIDDAKRALRIIQKLKPLVDIFFSENNDEPEPSMLFHADLSKHNILVTEDGTLAGVVDWECVSALPLWKACDYPAFLNGPARDTAPDRARYQHNENGDPDILYWDHLMQHEQTLLRHLFLSDMEMLSPGWVRVFNVSQHRRHFDTAVENCDNEFLAKLIDGWLGDMASGWVDAPSLRSRINSP